MEELVRLNREFEGAEPETILRWAVERYGDRLAMVTSFQPSGLVMLHMLREIAPELAILTLDTGLLFPETEALIDCWAGMYHLNLTRVTPAQTLTEQADAHGAALWERDPDQCCHLRKTIPLGDALRPFEAWITGVRRDQSTSRRETPLFRWDSKYDTVKIAPMAGWTESQVWTYIHAHHLPYNALHDQGYTSIGCFPCTRAVAPGEDIRAGRWSGIGKTECGIHQNG